MMYMS